MKKIILLFAAVLSFFTCMAKSDTSVDGFFPIASQGRQVWNFNPEWRFFLGDVKNAEAVDFDDSNWDVVSTPHCVKLEPAEASGCRNYQGKAWYRKHFVVPANRSEIYFEAIMGKQQIYINGRLATTHFGGYLPITVKLDEFGLHKGDSCVIAVMADNSDDKNYPPGKPQYALDFAYHGGIYRDVWLIAKNDVFITSPLAEDRRDAGIFVHYANISEHSADVMIDVNVRNVSNRMRRLNIENTLIDTCGKVIKRVHENIVVSAGQKSITEKISLHNPKLWSPECPYLYNLVTRVKEGPTTLDGGMTKIGIRSIEFRGKDGFWLNGKRYRKLIGGNRHQDFAYVGNAVPNSQQWRDVKRLKNCGFNIIRTAHYPQDPSFMDACDELGIFVIVATPGWQFWNKDTIFENRVLNNTHNIIRRDRNHPSVLMWEPILNETRYPLEFSLKSLQITRDEYPYDYRPAAAADLNSEGVRDHYDVVYGWPGDDLKPNSPRQCIFTREFGEFVDDWYAHNCINRASRSWGERPQLTQALSLAKTTGEMFTSSYQFIGGAQWHPFDHQRGYHPDPYWGGDYDAFRQPKYAAAMYETLGNQPVVNIAHELTPFSDSDVVVFSNCDSVRLSMYNGEKSWTLPVVHNQQYSAPVIFKGAWNFWEARGYSYMKKDWQKVNMLAEGIIGGKVVCSSRRMPSRRSTRLRLYADTMGKPLIADGSDFIVVVAEITDDNGNVRRLAKENVKFTVTGEGSIIDDGTINANPRAVEWGSAPILLRSTRKAGKIHIRAEVQFPGTHAPAPAEMDIESVPYKGGFCFIQQVDNRNSDSAESITEKHNSVVLSAKDKEKMLKEVEQQQADFGISK
jgi:beta-galactosidase